MFYSLGCVQLRVVAERRNVRLREFFTSNLEPDRCLLIDPYELLLLKSDLRCHASLFVTPTQIFSADTPLRPHRPFSLAEGYAYRFLHSMFIRTHRCKRSDQGHVLFSSPGCTGIICTSRCKRSDQGHILFSFPGCTCPPCT